MNPEVSQYIDQLKPWQKESATALRNMVFKTIPDAEERIQYGKPHFTKNGQYAAVISAAKDKLSFMIFNATELAEIKGYFQATTAPDRKTATIKEGQTTDYKQLADFLKKASKSI